MSQPSSVVIGISRAGFLNIPSPEPRASSPATRNSSPSDRMGGIIVRPRSRILHGHDWVFSSEILKTFGNPEDGSVVSIKDGRDQLLGVGIYNSKSQIVVRRFSRRRQDLDEDFFRRRIAQALEYRAGAGCRADLLRLVWSESDGLPGVIADRYGQMVVLQTLTMAMDLRRELFPF